jgi:hypothetical protein
LGRAVPVVAFLMLVLVCNARGFEKRRGFVRATQFLFCQNRCDLLYLEPDSGFAQILLHADPFVQLNLVNYLDMHVEVTGYRADCSGCGDFFVTDLLVLEPTGVADERGVPRAFLLLQNYPNPFNPATTLEYVLDTKSYVTLRVFDLPGREVSVLVASEQLPGLHRVVWDASGRTGGVYYYRLLAFEPEGRIRAQTRGMLLAR